MPRLTTRRRCSCQLLTQIMLLSFGRPLEIILDNGVDVGVGISSEVVDCENNLYSSSEIVAEDDIDVDNSYSGSFTDTIDEDIDGGSSSQTPNGIDENNVATSAERVDDNTISRQAIEQYYFGHEVDFMATQALLLGNHATSSSNESTDRDAEERVHRLRFIEKSLKIELGYIRSFRELKEKAHDSLTAEIEIDADPIHHVEKEIKRANHSSNISDAVNDATWPASAPLPSSADLPQTIYTFEMENEYDYDWMTRNGFAWTHDELDCREHAYSQDKPLYTLEKWNVLWNTFRKSTLFPFPIPKSDECPDEPFHTEHTTDGKGRGNFASRDIPEGSLIHSGHPNTVFFLDNKSFFRFVSSLPTKFACDVLEWAWQQDLTDSGNVLLCLNIDEAVFFNDGGYDLNTNTGMKTKSSLDFYALRDIAEGEELLYDYDHFDFDPHEMDL